MLIGAPRLACWWCMRAHACYNTNAWSCAPPPHRSPPLPLAPSPPPSLPPPPRHLDGHIAGPAIYQFQQVEARGAIFWEPLVLVIGLAEAWRVAVGWATPTGTGFNSLKDDYELGNLYFDPLGLKVWTRPPRVSLRSAWRSQSRAQIVCAALARFIAWS